MRSYPKTCLCGVEFEAEHHNIKYCPTCREERLNEQHPLKTCTKCGRESRDIKRNRWCLECRTGKKATPQKAAPTKHDPERLRSMGLWLVQMGEILLAAAEGERVDNVNPEEMPVANQDAIDMAFAAIMKDIDI